MKYFFCATYLIVLLSFPQISFSQSESDTTIRTVLMSSKRTESLEGKLFDASNGKPISMEKFARLIQEIPQIQLEHIYNKYGEMEKALYHPEAPTKKYNKRDPSKIPKIGEEFPMLVFKTIHGETLDLEKLKGQWVFLRFDFFTEMMDKENFSPFMESLSTIPSNIQFTGILASLDNTQNVETDLGSFSDQLKLIADSQGFFELLHITSIPTTFLISPDQKVVKYLNKENYSEISSLIQSGNYQ